MVVEDAASGQAQELSMDIYSPDFLANPFPSYAELRRAEPIAMLSRYGVWAVGRYDDVQAILRDPATYCSSGGASLRNYFKEKPWRTPSLLMETDAPVHTRARAVVARILSPAAIAKVKQKIEVEADALIASLVSHGRFDAVRDIGEVFPIKVFPDALGIDPEARENLLQYSRMVVAGFGPENEAAKNAMAHAEKVLPWIEQKCARASLAPGSWGTQVYEGADAGEIEEHEAPLLVRSFLSAGLDTSIRGLSQAIHCLATNTDQWKLLNEDPRLARAAFEEMLRYNSPAQVLWRTTTRTVEFRGVRIPKHEKVAVFIGSANRDPSRWEYPDRYDITRKTAGHVGLGTGIHGCVGQAMARVEGEAILSALARRVVKLELDGEPTRSEGTGMRGFKSIPIKIVPK